MPDAEHPSGILYLIPAPLNETAVENVVPRDILQLVGTLTHFVVEQEKAARAYLRQFPLQTRLQDLKLRALNEHTRKDQLAELIEPLLQGINVGLISDAGAPCVADPGADLVALCHKNNVRVRPCIGPSSILLSLMASGLGGQKFQFHGYLPADRDGKEDFLRTVERDSAEGGGTQIFMDTPYRTDSAINTALATLREDTMLCVAANLQGVSESIRTQSVRSWRAEPPNLGKIPAIILLSAMPSRRQT